MCKAQPADNFRVVAGQMFGIYESAQPNWMGYGQYHCRREYSGRRWRWSSTRIRVSPDHRPGGNHRRPVWLQDSAQVRTLLVDGHACLHVYCRRLRRQTFRQRAHGQRGGRDFECLELRDGNHWIPDFVVSRYCWFVVPA